jgi:SAM-dependent methyltransferase
MILSTCYDPADYDHLVEELAIVDRIGIEGQHAARRWEYAIALRALRQWEGQQVDRLEIFRTWKVLVDVGGAGSNFCRLAMAEGWGPTITVDPRETVDLADYLLTQPRRPALADAVVCLSVLEHVDDLDRFVYHLSCLVAPGGLLCLTVDYCDDDTRTGWPEDTAHFHWMRKRIFNRGQLERLRRDFRDLQLFDFGDAPVWQYGQPIEEGWGYTFASLILQKRS